MIITYDGDKAGQAATAKALEELGDYHSKLFRSLMQWILMSIYKEFSRGFGLSFLSIHESVRLSFIFIITNQVIVKISTIDFIEKIAPLIVKEPSIWPEHYIHLLTDHFLPSFAVINKFEHIIKRKS